MSVWNRATFEEKYAACVVVLAVLWLAWRHEEHQVEEWKRRQQRDSVTLREEALQRLESGESLEMTRWHGDSLELEAAANAATSDQEEDVDDSED